MPKTLLTIELKKGKDGPSSMACIRTDGTRTWARLHPFFPTHDLTHCAVESVLGMTEAFFGLISSGWAIDDFAQPGTSRRLPVQALWAEHLVGLLEHRIANEAKSLNIAWQSVLVASSSSLPPPLTDEALSRIVRIREQLGVVWQYLLLGETLRIAFPVTDDILSESLNV